MDKEWTEQNKAVKPASVTAGTENYANFHANGTGPFMITERETDVKTVFKPFAGWWDKPQHNVTEAIMTPIGSDATRVAAFRCTKPRAVAWLAFSISPTRNSCRSISITTRIRRFSTPIRPK